MTDGGAPLHLSIPDMSDREVALVTEALKTGWVSTSGPFVDEFESLFAKYTGAERAVTIVNGTMAIYLALRMLDIGPGDEVIVPTFTFVATVNPVVYCGATPVFVDVDEETMNIDAAAIEAVITPRTKAIMPVHLYGHPAEMDQILDIARKHNIPVVEDATNALGSRYHGTREETKNRHPGTMGVMGCFSFNANKIITTGGGGMIVTMDPELGARAKYLSTQARPPGREYYHPDVGYNFRLPNVLAAIGVAQMERLAGFVEQRREIAQRYQQLLADVPGVTCAVEKPWAHHCWWMFSITIDPQRFGATKDEVLDELERHKIGCRPLFIPNHTFPQFAHYPHGEITRAQRLWERGIQLPSHSRITAEDQARVVDVIAALGRKKQR